mmetsp:Transcript_279/g.466  ORF Transcript_279/g.466 Transcript_279/m.466 type:complete len:91 (-) Transcript_279:607-879(-)
MQISYRRTCRKDRRGLGMDFDPCLVDKSRNQSSPCNSKIGVFATTIAKVALSPLPSNMKGLCFCLHPNPFSHMLILLATIPTDWDKGLAV